MKTIQVCSSKFYLLVVFLAGCAAARGQATRSQQLAPLPFDDVLRMRSLGEVLPMEVSPDGTWLAYTVHSRTGSVPRDDYEFFRTGVPVFGLGCDLYLVNIRTREIKNLTGDKGSNWLPGWSPDSRYLAFLSDRDGSGSARVWIWDSVHDQLTKGSDAAISMFGSQAIQWTRDGRQVVVATVPEGMSGAEYLSTAMFGGAAGMTFPEGKSSSSVLLYRSQAIAPNEQVRPGSEALNRSLTLHDLTLVNVVQQKTRTLIHGQRVSTFALSPDGSFLVYARPQASDRPGSQELLFDLHAMSLFTNEEKVVASGIRLTAGIPAFSISPDSSKLSYRSIGVGQKRLDVYVVDLNGGKARNVTRFNTPAAGDSVAKNQQWPFSPIAQPYSLKPLWAPDGDFVYFIDGGTFWRAAVLQNDVQEVARIENRQVIKLLSPRPDLLWMPRGKKSTIVITRDDLGKQDGFYKVDLTTGVTTKLRESGECFTCTRAMEGKFMTAVPDGTFFAYSSEDAEHGPDIWWGDADFRNRSRLTHLNPEIENYKMGTARVIDWLDDDGEKRQGALMLPSDYQEGRRYPLVVLVYGGRRLSDSVTKFGGFDSVLRYSNIQLLATRGYAILMPDVPQRLGTPMLDTAKAVLPGVNRVVEMGIADPDRLGVMGHSYGGYTTLALIVQTTRFKAAIEASGFGNLVGLYGEMDKDGTGFGTALEASGQLMGGSPWEYRDSYIENSPIFYLNRVGTPLLVVHGAEDTASAPFLGDELFVGLRRLGKQVEYVKYEGEAHLLVSYSNQLDLCNRMIAWFDNHLKK
jgi:dipeptidyl aminopeptidase/acylaminoacyl peptidase